MRIEPIIDSDGESIMEIDLSETNELLDRIHTRLGWILFWIFIAVVFSGSQL